MNSDEMQLTDGVKKVRTGYKGSRTLKARLLRKLLRAYYRLCTATPLDPDLAVFSAYWSRQYACNPKAIYEAARRLVPGFRGVWIVEAKYKDQIPKGVEFVISGTRAYYEVLARASVFVNNVNPPDEYIKRSHAIFLMTHHGTPLKYMGADFRRKVGQGGADDLEKMRKRVGAWDLSLSSNPFSTEVWERVYPGPYQSLELGYPRNDILVQATADDRQTIRELLGIEEKARVLLYAPTYREYVDSYVQYLDVERLASQLGGDWVILSRRHYLYEGERNAEEGQARTIDVSNYPNVEELCIASDVLCTDYSSIMFDYAVQAKPIIIHAPDWEEYVERRGTYFDLLRDSPGVVVRTQDELVNALLEERWEEPAAREALGAFRQRFCGIDDGRAAERVIARIWGR